MTDFTVVALARTFASGVSASVDLLSAASDLARQKGAPIPSWRIASLHGGLIRLATAFSVETGVLGGQAQDRSTWIIPTLADTAGSDQEDQVGADLNALVDQIRLHVARGGKVAASSSALLLLAKAGVIRGRRVAASESIAGALRQADPAAYLDLERILCVDGPITTCSAPLSQTDLMVYLFSQLCGPRFASELARKWLRPVEPSFPLSNLLSSHEARDTLVAKLVEKVEMSLPEAPSVAELAFDLDISERTLSRYVRSVTGKSTRELVQDVKLRRARTLLERSRLSVDQIAAAVGYSDSTALRRLMKKVTGAQPSRFRMACLPA